MTTEKFGIQMDPRKENWQEQECIGLGEIGELSLPWVGS